MTVVDRLTLKFDIRLPPSPGLTIVILFIGGRSWNLTPQNYWCC